MRYISFLTIVATLIACSKKQEIPIPCNINNKKYVDIGDTIPLMLCSNLGGDLWGGIEQTHWVVTNENHDIVFENNNQNTYFVVPDSGYYYASISPGGYSELIFRTSLKISVYSTNSNFSDPYKITLQDTSGNILGIDTISHSYPNIIYYEDIPCEDPQNANFEVYDGERFTLYGENINNPNQIWSDTIYFDALTLQCLKVEMK